MAIGTPVEGALSTSNRFGPFQGTASIDLQESIERVVECFGCADRTIQPLARLLFRRY